MCIRDSSYTELLERANIPSLASRRLRMVDKFILKAAAHPSHKHWFPAKQMSGYGLRNELVYKEKKARTSRLYNSPLYFYRRRLNCI